MMEIINVWNRILVGNPEGRDQLVDVGLDGRII
jgi:hypothetical protein